jgi:hypothetical protein
MQQIPLDADAIERLRALRESAEIVDSAGRVVGVFEPALPAIPLDPRAALDSRPRPAVDPREAVIDLADRRHYRRASTALVPETVESLSEYCASRGRAVPRDWHRLFDILKRWHLSAAKAPPPFVIAQWDPAHAVERQDRLMEQIAWAGEHGCLSAVSRHLRQLTEEEWYHFGKQ